MQRRMAPSQSVGEKVSVWSPRGSGAPLSSQLMMFFGRQFGQNSDRLTNGIAPEIEASTEQGGREAAASADAQTVLSRPGLGHGSYDFSRVRVHTDAEASEAARNAGANAYTFGKHVVFAAGRYRPETPAGLRLLAHELAHVVQQGTEGRPRIDRFEARVHESVERLSLTRDGVMSQEEAGAVYFGNWMRDMNQVFVPMLTRILPSDVLFLFVSYLAASKFGRELTPEQFGFYIPAEHLDNPAGLVMSNPAVASDDLLPGQPAVSGAARPVAPDRLGRERPRVLDTRQEDVGAVTGAVLGQNIFSVDQTGVMAFIRRTNLHVERRLRLAADAGRTPDGMHHFGAALHAIEDLFAHSNFVEIALDLLLRESGGLRTALGSERVFTFAPEIQIEERGRPVLTTGTFTGADTMISIASEVVGVLAHPLPDPRPGQEERAQDRFVVALLRAFETRLRGNPQLQGVMDAALRQAGVPEALASSVRRLPLADIYELQTVLSIPIPDSIRLPLRRAIRGVVSEHVLQPLAGTVQAAAMDVAVADTNLIQVFRDSQRQAASQFSADELQRMAALETLTQEPVATQQREAAAAAGRRTAAIAATPLPVVAGPSHSQLAKDHPNSPFFGLAFALGHAAAVRIRDRMVEAWSESAGGASVPFDFSEFPAVAPPGSAPSVAAAHKQARELYQQGRGRRATEAGVSRQLGEEILANGGAVGQPYDLARMRVESAARIRAISSAVRGAASAPGTSAQGISGLRDQLRGLPDAVREHVDLQLRQAGRAATAAGGSQMVANLDHLATQLNQAAAIVEAARRHAQREAAWSSLMALRAQMLQAFANTPAVDRGLAVMILLALDAEIQSTALTYRTEQRAVLEGSQGVSQLPLARPRLERSVITLPQIAGSPATVRLLAEARRIMSHPYQDRWWTDIVRTYARRFPDRLRNDIEARNEGVPFYRTSATRSGNGHNHP